MNLGRVPPFYVECAHDRAVPLATQRQMQANVRIDGVFTLDADDSPFFSAPGELTRCLETVLTSGG